MRQRFDERADIGGVTRAQWSVLAAVSRRPGATQRVLANLLSVTDVTSGRMIDRLCVEGYLERREDPDDRRAYRVYLTERAGPVLARLTKAATLFDDALFADFSEQDLASLDTLLDRMAHNLGDELVIED